MISRSNCFFVAGPMCFVQIDPSRASKYEVGMATNFEVVQAQRDLSDSQNSELRAILNYRRALVNFEQAQTVGSGTNLSTVGVVGGGGNATGGTQIGGQTGGGGGQ